MLSPQLFLCFTVSFYVASAQSEGSCVGRCGQGYIRADPCHCDYNCMSYMECCPDYKAVCTTERSCQGRCHEGFIRGQTCDCDPSCVGYGKCCPDFEDYCVQPVQRQSPPPSSPQLPDPEPKDDSLKPTRKPEERLPEHTPEDPNDKPSKDKKKPQGKSPKSPKKKKSETLVKSEEDIEESEENLSSSSYSSSSSSSSVKGSKKTKKSSRKNQKKKKPQDEDDIPDPDNPETNKKPKDKDDETKKPRSPKIREGDDDPDNPETPPKAEELPASPEDENGKPQNTKPSKEETEHSEDSPRKPLPSDKRKRNPPANKPNKKKKVNPGDDADDEPLKPGKGKTTKKKPSSKDIVKRKKKIGSEEERQETVESEYSSSSQSSSSHSRSKSSRRLTGKNKKNKKKFPEEPEEPLMPPKKRKYPFPTPVYTSPDEGSGEDGSGMTTIVPTTVRFNTTTNMPTTSGTNKTEGTLKPSVKSQTEGVSGSSYKTTINIPIPVSTEKQSTGSSATTVLYNQSSTQGEKIKGLNTIISTPPQQMSTLKTPQDQSTTDSNVEHATHSSPAKDSETSPKTQTMDHSTNKMNAYSTTSAPLSTLLPNEFQSQTKHTMDLTDVTLSTNPTTRHTNQSATTGQSVKLTTGQPDMDQATKQLEQRTKPGEGSSYKVATKEVPNTKTTSISKHTTTTPDPKDLFTTMPNNEDEIETSKATTPHTIHPHHICNLLKDEAINLRIPASDLKHITEICAEMQQQYPNVNMPSTQTRQPNIDDRNIFPRYPLSEGAPAIWYQQPGSRILEIIEEINRRMNTSPITNLTGISSQNTHKSTAWLLLINKIKLANDPQMNLCIGQPADGITTLQNGSLVVFRGHYFWTLNQGGATGMPRKISEVWGIPSPIDTVFTRCNCGGKTFFFKGPQYWRFTNDVMDKGYPKEVIKGFGGLRGKVTAVLSVAGFKTRPESVYFFKPGGNVQKYTFRQEQSKRCTKKKQPSVNYPIYSQKVQTVKFRFPRDIVQHRIQIRRTFSSIPQPLGILHEERSVRSTWRGIPMNIVSAVSLPNLQKQDGFDYFVFNKEKYYNINMSSKVAMKPPTQAEQKTTKDWYKCKE